MTIDLRKKPFCLNDSSIDWVYRTLDSMTLEEKIGQLFCPIVFTSDESELKDLLEKKHIGGLLYREGKASEVLKNHNFLQKNSKIPLLIASNLEQGGTGSAVEGTFFGKQMEVAATGNKERAYQLGKVACSEGAAVGVNWTFAPIVDIDYNFRNPITNIRTFGDDPQRVADMASEYMKAAMECNVATSIKHFPGDGRDERDQHLLVTVNDMSCEEWDETYGMIYQRLINEGSLTVMAGHIAMPSYEEKLCGETVDKLIPATLSKALLQGLLRERLGFNGLIVTDATPMVGFCAAMPREISVPTAIASGCDMFLFNKDLNEDYEFMMKGYQNGILTEERLKEAIIRILATKAALGLDEKQRENKLIISENKLSILGCKEHKGLAAECADEAITLVKDTQNLLPIHPSKQKRVLLEILGEFDSNERVYNHFEELLTKQGFEITKYVPENFGMPLDNVTDIKAKYDLVMYIGNVDNASNKTVSRINWHTLFGMGNNMPWFVEEVPTLFVSVGNPYHLLDVPMIKTYINGYCNSPFVIDAVVEKICGHSSFKGVSPIDPFCGRKDTRY